MGTAVSGYVKCPNCNSDTPASDFLGEWCRGCVIAEIHRRVPEEQRKADREYTREVLRVAFGREVEL